MKTKILITVGVCIICLVNICNQKALALSGLNLHDSIRIYSSTELYDLTSSWVEEYSKINQSVKIKTFKIEDIQSDVNINSESGLYFISDNLAPEQKNKSFWTMTIGVEVIVPIVNSKNPFYEDIKTKGVSSENLAQIFKNKRNKNWGTLLKEGSGKSVNFYCVEKKSFNSDIANYLKIEPSFISGINVRNEEDLISAVRKDPYGVGFCRIASILNSESKSIVEGVSLLPIDKNSNGRIDASEKIYADLNTFLRGVWIGKYPKELCKNIYSISALKPVSEDEIAFLAWIITDGQQFLNSNGFSNLASNLRDSNINKLYEKQVDTKASSSRSVLPIAAVILVVFVTLFFAVDYVVQRFKFEKTSVVDASSISSRYIDEKSIAVLDGLYFDKSHTWAFMERDGVVSIGIDDFLQHVTGSITRIKMKSPGEEIRKGEPFLTIIQEGKQLNINAPITGVIKAQNQRLLTNASIINSSPYSEGWIYMIEPYHWLRDTQFLIIAKGYREWIKMEFLHLKDFLAVTLRAEFADKAQIILQDGGEIKDGILKDLKPEIWEDFQTHFLNCSK